MKLGYVSGMDDDVIARLGLIVTREGSREERAARAAELVRRVAGARWAGIYTVTGTVVNCDGWSGPGAPAHPSFAVTEGLTAHAIRTGALALSNDVSRDPRYLANQDDSGSELIVPILVGGRVAGTLDVESDRSGPSAAPPSWSTSDLPPPCAGCGTSRPAGSQRAAASGAHKRVISRITGVTNIPATRCCER